MGTHQVWVQVHDRPFRGASAGVNVTPITLDAPLGPIRLGVAAMESRSCAMGVRYGV